MENFVCLEKRHFQQLELFKPISIPFKHAQLMNAWYTKGYPIKMGKLLLLWLPEW